VTSNHRLDGRQVRLDAVETSLEQLDQSRALNSEEPVVSLPAEQFASNAAVNLLIYLRVDVTPRTLSPEYMHHQQVLGVKTETFYFMS